MDWIIFGAVAAWAAVATFAAFYCERKRRQVRSIWWQQVQERSAVSDALLRYAVLNHTMVVGRLFEAQELTVPASDPPESWSDLATLIERDAAVLEATADATDNDVRELVDVLRNNAKILDDFGW
ncbi:MAG: hypothetical protein OXK76_11450 [Gammaproteobacteria bacterium]|nr:hypothetical protein [Gammaproteobacteria bacterium]